MTTQKFIYATIEEVQAKKAELEAIHGADNVTMNISREVYFYVGFNIFN